MLLALTVNDVRTRREICSIDHLKAFFFCDDLTDQETRQFISVVSGFNPYSNSFAHLLACWGFLFYEHGRTKTRTVYSLFLTVIERISCEL